MSLTTPREAAAGERLRRLMPSFTVLLAMLLMALPLPLAWGVMPNFAWLLVIIWASLQPRLMPAWVALVLGLLADLVSGMPLGVQGFLFTASVIAVRLVEARMEGRSLALDWLFAAILLLAGHVIGWQLLGFTGNRAPLLPMLAQAGITLLAYPPAMALAARVRRRMIERSGWA